MDFNELIVRFFGVIGRRKFLCSLLFAAIFIGAVAGAYIKPQQFQSEAKLMVTLQAPRIDSSNSEERQVTALIEPEEIMAAQVEIMTTREAIEQLVDELPEWVFVSEPSKKWYVIWIVNPLKDVIDWVKNLLRKALLIQPENERYDRITMIEKNLRVFPVRKAHVIEVVFRAKKPDVPPVVIGKLIELYQARVTEIRSSSEGFNLYHQRAEAIGEELVAAERDRATFMLQHNLSDLRSEREQLVRRVSEQNLRSDEQRLAKLIELEPEYNLLNRRVAVLTESYSVYQKAAADQATFFDRDTKILAQLIDPPATIYKPLKPSRLVLVLLGFVASVVLSIVIVLLVEWITKIRMLYRPETSAPEAKSPERA